MSDLVERATRAFLGFEGEVLWDQEFWEKGTDLREAQVELWCSRAEYESRMRDAVALVLEEAVRVASRWDTLHFENGVTHHSNIGEEIAKDIRNLIKENK